MKGLNDNKQPVRNILEEEHLKLREWKTPSHLDRREPGVFKNESEIQPCWSPVRWEESGTGVDLLNM